MTWTDVIGDVVGICKGGGALRRIGFDKLEGADLRVPIEITFSREACYYIYILTQSATR